MSKKLKIIIGVVLLVVGIGLVSYQPIINHFITPKVLEKTYESTFKEVAKSDMQKNQEKAQKEHNDKDFNFDDVTLLSGDITKLNPNVDKSKVIGEIYVPSVNLHLPITYGTTNENLLYSATIMKKNQIMGKGNYSLAGHNAVNKSVLFAPLHDVKNKDFVYVTDKDKVFKYLVRDVLVVSPKEVNVIKDVKGEQMITLVTCEDFAGTKRLIVQGTLYDVQDYKENMELEKSYK